MGETQTRPSRTSAERETTADALAELTVAWRSIEDARAHLSHYHHEAGLGDAHLVRAVALLRSAGHHDLADAVCHRLVGHGAEDRWSFQADEDDDDDFRRTLMTLEQQVRGRLA